jgi:hypothetical protein
MNKLPSGRENRTKNKLPLRRDNGIPRIDSPQGMIIIM